MTLQDKCKICEKGKLYKSGKCFKCYRDFPLEEVF